MRKWSLVVTPGCASAIAQPVRRTPFACVKEGDTDDRMHVVIHGLLCWLALLLPQRANIHLANYVLSGRRSR